MTSPAVVAERSERRPQTASLLVVCVLTCSACANDSSPSDVLQDARMLDRSPSCTTGSLDCCYVGAAFADCGLGTPRPFCSTSETEGCLWISNGSAVGNYRGLLQADCTCSPVVCPFPRTAFVLAYGTEPWDRTRAMNLPVRLDATIQAPSKPEVDCPLCSATCPAGPTVCVKELRGDPDFVVEITSSRGLPGTFIQRLDLRGALASTYLEIEVDIRADPLVARACQLYRTDHQQCSTSKGPLCAVSGEVSLSALPAASNLTTIAGRFSAKFVDGFVINGSF